MANTITIGIDQGTYSFVNDTRVITLADIDFTPIQEALAYVVNLTQKEEYYAPMSPFIRAEIDGLDIVLTDTSKATLKTDDVLHIQFFIASAKVNEDGQLHTVMEGHLCECNSTTTLLLADAVYTGDGLDILAYNGISVFATSDVSSATQGLEIQYSADGSTNWRCAETYTILAGAEKWFSPPSFGKYFRVVYTNGDADQTSFEITTVMRKTPFKWSSHNIDMPITDQDDAELTKSVITGKKPNGDYDNVSLTNGGNMKVSIEEFEDEVSIDLTSFADNLDGEKAMHTAAAMFGRVNDDSVAPIKIDGSTQDIQVITHEHAEIHGGDHYHIVDYVELAINNVYDIQITTPDTAKWAHLTFDIDVESETEWCAYLDVVINTQGSPENVLNNNENSVNTSGLVVNGISNTSVANANLDTDISGASIRECGIIGSGKKSLGASSRAREIELKQNSIYTLRFIAKAAGYVNYDLEWYEHTDKII